MEVLLIAGIIGALFLFSKHHSTDAPVTVPAPSPPGFADSTGQGMQLGPGGIWRPIIAPQKQPVPAVTPPSPDAATEAVQAAGTAAQVAKAGAGIAAALGLTGAGASAAAGAGTAAGATAASAAAASGATAAGVSSVAATSAVEASGAAAGAASGAGGTAAAGATGGAATSVAAIGIPVAAVGVFTWAVVGDIYENAAARTWEAEQHAEHDFDPEVSVLPSPYGGTVTVGGYKGPPPRDSDIKPVPVINPPNPPPPPASPSATPQGTGKGRLFLD